MFKLPLNQMVKSFLFYEKLFLKSYFDFSMMWIETYSISLH